MATVTQMVSKDELSGGNVENRTSSNGDIEVSEVEVVGAKCKKPDSNSSYAESNLVLQKDDERQLETVTRDVAEDVQMVKKLIKGKIETTNSEELGDDLQDAYYKRRSCGVLAEDIAVSGKKKAKHDCKPQLSSSENAVEHADSTATESKNEGSAVFDQNCQECGHKVESDSAKQPDASSPTKRTKNSSYSDGLAEKRRRSADNNDIESEIREKSVAMLAKALGNDETFHDLANTIEEAVYNEFHDANDHRYRSRVRSRVSNLNRNPAIGCQLINGKIKPDQFARMTADELATRELKELREEMESSIDEHLLPEHEVVGTENCKKSDNAV